MTIFYQGALGFYFSNDGESWEQLGFDHTNGSIINLIENDSFFEVGGWGMVSLLMNLT